MDFNNNQKEVIRCKNNALIYASAGTGKTSTLAEKIRLQILDDNIEPKSILCLTFTNRGCEEIRKKVSENIDDKFFNDLTIKTFHSFCFQLINEYRNLNGFLTNRTNIYDEDDCRLLCKNLIEEVGLNLLFKDNNDGLNKLIGYVKEERNKKGNFNGDYLKSLLDTANDLFLNKKEQLDEAFMTATKKLYGDPVCKLTQMINANELQKVLIEYQNQLELADALDFNDLVYYANLYIGDDNFRNLTASKYNWIYIDESQDTSFTEYLLIKKISSQSKVVLSGDFFQTIYEWRGSNPDLIINDFVNSFNPEIFYYNVNYRSTKNIAMASFSVLRKMFPNRVDDIYKKGIESANIQDGDKIKIHCAQEIKDEAEFIHKCVLSNNAKDTCILVRTNPYAISLSTYLDKLCPNKYFLVQDYQYYRRPEVKEILAFLRLMISPYDFASLERIGLKYVRYFGETKLTELTKDETKQVGVRISDFLDQKTHDYYGDLYGKLIEDLKLGNVVVFDTETTGLNIDSDEIIQIACRKINIYGEELDRFTTLVKSNKSVGDSFCVHHISDFDLQTKGMDKKDALRKFLEFTNGATLVGHNVTYDISMINSELERNGLEIINCAFYDTLDISRRFICGVKNYKLATLTEFLKLPDVGYHDAMEDVIATSNLLIYLVNNPIFSTSKVRKQIINKYLHLFRRLTEVLNSFRLELYSSGFEAFVEDAIHALGVEKVYFDKELSLFNIRHFLKLSKLFSKENASNYNCLRRIINLAALSTNDFDAIYKEHGLIPVITVHQSKGCEFDTVFMAGVEDGVYPAFYAKGKSDDEEKRVFYVGITRAKKQLIISYRQLKDNGYGKKYLVNRSPFIDLFDRFYLENI